MKPRQKETIKDAIAHLSSYKNYLEGRIGVPSISIENNIKELRELLKEN